MTVCFAVSVFDLAHDRIEIVFGCVYFRLRVGQSRYFFGTKFLDAKIMAAKPVRNDNG